MKKLALKLQERSEIRQMKLEREKRKWKNKKWNKNQEREQKLKE